MVTITLKGREIPLLYTTQEMLTIQEDIAPIGDAISLISGKDPGAEFDIEHPEKGIIFGSKEHLKALGAAIRILGNAGLEEAGEEANLTTKGVLRSLRQSELRDTVNTVLNAFVDGMQSEIPPKDDGPVDVVLEEINRKKDGTN